MVMIAAKVSKIVHLKFPKLIHLKLLVSDFGNYGSNKAELLQEGIFSRLRFLPREILLVKKFEIELCKHTILFQISKLI